MAMKKNGRAWLMFVQAVLSGMLGRHHLRVSEPGSLGWEVGVLLITIHGGLLVWAIKGIVAHPEAKGGRS